MVTCCYATNVTSGILHLFHLNIKYRAGPRAGQLGTRPEVKTWLE